MKKNKTTVPYQFDISPRKRALAIEKAKLYGVALATYMRVALDDFIEKPIEEIMRTIKSHHSAQQNKRR